MPPGGAAADGAPRVRRHEFRRLATLRLDEARALLTANLPSGAYYLSGYALECALKACAAKSFLRHDIPKKEVVASLYHHNLERLIRAAGLEAQLQAAMAANAALQVNWATAKNWNEVSRYTTWTMAQATDIVDAVGHRQDGVLRWIRRHW